MTLARETGKIIVGVVGAGTMGRGIAQVTAQGGMSAVVFDEKAGAAEAARTYVGDMLARLAAKGTIGAADADAAVKRIAVAGSLEDLARCDVVVEAIVERLEPKQELFRRLEDIVREDTILASNTSSLPITAIFSRCRLPGRTGGLHFFNPVPLMRLVEVIPGLASEPGVVDDLMRLARAMTREPILCADSPGFVVNHLGRAYVPESQRIVADAIVDHAGLDRIMTGAPGFRMGPFTLLDLIGMDVSHAVMESLYGQFYQEPAYAPSPLTALRVAGGMYGQKTGRGWYAYREGKKVEQARAPAPAARPAKVWVLRSDNHPELQTPLIDLLAKAGATLEHGSAPSPEAIVVATPVGYDVTDVVTDLGLPAERTVGVDVLFGMKGPRTLMVSPATAPATIGVVHGLLAADGTPVEVIADSPGFVAQRVVAQIVNVGCTIAQRAIATPADIDKGAKLGLGYPFGPFEWGDRIGLKRVCHILDRLYQRTRDPRYRASPWLTRRAALGLPLAAPDRQA